MTAPVSLNEELIYGGIGGCPGFPINLGPMKAGPAQAVLLARALEEADPEGQLLRRADRERATAQARALPGDLEARATLRAEVLLAAASAEVPALARLAKAARVPRVLLWSLPVLALGAGLATDGFGPSRQVNVLAPPLLGLLGWNLLIYAIFIVSGLRRLAHRGAPSRVAGAIRTESTALTRWPRGGAARLWQAGFKAAVSALRRGVDPRRSLILAAAGRRFARDWVAVAGPMIEAQLRSSLHLAAAALAAGMVAGLYLRGLTVAYRSTWESTFLGAAEVRGLLVAVLGPAAAVLGVDLPDVAGFKAMQSPRQGADAAVWLHLWALTTALLVLTPRLVFSISAGLRARRLSRRLGIRPDAGAFRVLRDPHAGTGRHVVVRPYSRSLDGLESDALLLLLHDALGSAALIEIRPPALWGEGHAGGAAEIFADGPTVVLFSSVQLPELEVHRVFVHDLKTAAPEAPLLAMVDEAAWRRRFGPAERERAIQRRRAWQRVLGETGAVVLHLDLGQSFDEDLLRQVEQALGAPTDIRGAGR